jgi:hypothetical protein
MKKFTIVVFLTWHSMIAYSSVRTVNNLGGAQFVDIQSALNASSAGDTIYICGSTAAYAGPTAIKNNIVFIGTGFNVQKQNPIKSTITGTFKVGDGNSLIGLEILGQVSFLDGNTGLTIQRCRMAQNFDSNSPYRCFNMKIDRCIINQFLFIFNRISNLVLTNTIFYTSSVFNQVISADNALVDHCVFEGGSSNQSVFSVPPPSGFTFTNNIFYGMNPNAVAGYNYINNYSPVNYLNNYGTGNIISSVWPFVASQGTTVGFSFQYSYDFSVLPSSQAHNAATDGTDLGAYGGATPYTGSGEPGIPQIDVLNIVGSQFAPGGTMNIQFQSTIGN